KREQMHDAGCAFEQWRGCFDLLQEHRPFTFSGTTELVRRSAFISVDQRYEVQSAAAERPRPLCAVISPYDSGRRSRKNCHTRRTSSIMSRSRSATTNSSLLRLACATIFPRGLQK